MTLYSRRGIKLESENGEFERPDSLSAADVLGILEIPVLQK